MRLFSRCITCLLLGQLSLLATDSVPQTLAELNRWYLEPETNQNAAVPYLQACVELTTNNAALEESELPWINGGDMPLITRSLPENLKLAAASLGERIHLAWPLLKKGSTVNHSRYPIDFKLGPEVPLPHLTYVRGSSHLLAIWTTYESSIGEEEQAVDALVFNLLLAKSLNEEPLLISQQCRAKCIACAIQSLEQLLNRTAVSTENLDRLRDMQWDLFERGESAKGLIRGLVGDSLMAKSILDLPLPDLTNLLSHVPEEILSPGRLTIIQDNYSRADDQVFAERTFTQLLAACTNTPPTLFNEVERLCTKQESVAVKSNLVVSTLATRRIELALDAEVRGLAYLGLGMIAVALEQFRSSNDGSYPTSLNELTHRYLTVTPPSPFGSGSFRYQKAGRGFLLSAVDDRPYHNKQSIYLSVRAQPQ